jgi:hypothetical protein
MKATLAAVSSAALALAASTYAHGPHAGHANAGVVGLDVYAQGAVVDLLVAENGPAGVELRHQRSRDGGRTWAQSHVVAAGAARVARPRRGNDPQVVAAGDRLVAVWSAAGTTSRWGGPLAAAVSDDAGATWREAPPPAGTGFGGAHGFVDLAAGAGGRVYVVWLDSRDGAQGLRASVSPDLGRTWHDPVTVDARTCECCANRVLASGGERAAILYRDKDPRDMAVARTADGGRTWTRAGVAGAFSWQFEGCPEVGGALVPAAGPDALRALVWTGAEDHAGLHLVSSEDSGRTFTAPRRLGGATARHGDLAAHGQRLLAVWEALEAGGAKVMAAASADGGTTWDAPRRLSAATVRASQPLVVATGEGHFLVVWTEKSGTGPVRWNSALT